MDIVIGVINHVYIVLDLLFSNVCNVIMVIIYIGDNVSQVHVLLLLILLFYQLNNVKIVHGDALYVHHQLYVNNVLVDYIYIMVHVWTHVLLVLIIHGLHIHVRHAHHIAHHVLLIYPVINVNQIIHYIMVHVCMDVLILLMLLIIILVYNANPALINVSIVLDYINVLSAHLVLFYKMVNAQKIVRLVNFIIVLMEHAKDVVLIVILVLPGAVLIVKLAIFHTMAHAYKTVHLVPTQYYKPNNVPHAYRLAKPVHHNINVNHVKQVIH